MFCIGLSSSYYDKSQAPMEGQRKANLKIRKVTARVGLPIKEKGSVWQLN
jgi:hypothetical protein